MTENYEVEVAGETKVRLQPLGECALIVDWGGTIHEHTHTKIRAFCSQLERNPVHGIVEVVPAYTTVTVFYDPIKLWKRATSETWQSSYNRDTEFQSPFAIMEEIIREMVNQLEEIHIGSSTIVEIPVCYGEQFGPDLQDVAAYAGLSIEEVIELHSGHDYLVHMVGFAPGFPYLGGLPERIAVPRRSSPRTSIKPGSVGIGGKQTGVYPIASPGGWHLIGQTPVQLFRPHHPSPSLLKMGDTVRFRPITPEQFAMWKEDAI
ncbi:5-oxoprolinase subunit PxpB [Paenibacillus sp. 481]|uniref:5-oxoprolinase subunit PxpB n=1 Tax=Paenibacillus sp. 481 TaxID=2835869 RepID=UPI001E28FBDF|nr:5-oxoprolinase subunit PxpB [Paenibacillus sp. 481]UHA73672.1 5-oxoprolinase subunit PxpB [Paenibacillus sp. 481]